MLYKYYEAIRLTTLGLWRGYKTYTAEINNTQLAIEAEPNGIKEYYLEIRDKSGVYRKTFNKAAEAAKEFCETFWKLKEKQTMEEKVYFAHPKLHNNGYPSFEVGRITVAFKHLEDTEDAHVLNVGIGWCSPKDNFNRKRGREEAAKRLQEKPVQCLVRKNVGKMETHDLLQVVERHVLPPEVVNGLDRPKWLLKMYKEFGDLSF